MKYLSLDVGERRIGVAVSDELGMFAHPRETINCGGKQEFKRIIEIIKAERPAGIIVGHPLELGGKRGERALWVEKFCDKLRGHFSAYEELRSLQIQLWDERLSSVEAERNLKLSGAQTRKIRKNPKKKQSEERKAMTDSVAAVIILESYLSSQVSRGSQGEE